MLDAAHALVEVVAGRLSAAAARWMPELGGPDLDLPAFSRAFASASRRLGKGALSPSAHEAERLQRAGFTWPIARVGLDEAARMALLVQAVERVGDADVSLVEEVYRQGDNRERQSVLRALPLLPRPDRFLSLAVESCRTSVQPIFEAIACENPYPAAHFPELSFNQMVLKALFTEVPLDRILALQSRVTPELRRMARDYASERAAAGRTVPEDIAVIGS